MRAFKKKEAIKQVNIFVLFNLKDIIQIKGLLFKAIPFYIHRSK